jgi:drug/metabolite transporter (DMT)-like permease
MKLLIDLFPLVRRTGSILKTSSLPSQQVQNAQPLFVFLGCTFLTQRLFLNYFWLENIYSPVTSFVLVSTRVTLTVLYSNYPLSVKM